jgi:hypothetical protein
MKPKSAFRVAICFVCLIANASLIAQGYSTPGNKKITTGKTNAARKSIKREAAIKEADVAEAAPATPCPNKAYVRGCNIPFQNPVSHQIDQDCPNEGNCNAAGGSKLQNEFKNNYCAKGTPVEITFATMDRLQKAVDNMVAKKQITYGKGGIPPKPETRTKLAALPTVDANGNPVILGEGKLVVMEGFVLDAKHDDSFPLGFKGEGVNCNNSALDFNDIHIALGKTARTPECSSVTAEVIPHFRSAVLDRFDSNPITAPHVPNALPVKGIQVRITGQLFFDGSHIPKPCKPPRRRASWEIHPIYNIEVFDGSKFISLEEWAASH